MKAFLKSLITNKKRLATSIIIILVLGYIGYQHFSATAAPTRYLTAQAVKQTIVVSVTGTGQVSQNHTVNVTPQSSGQITSINVKQGDTVKAGQTIATIDETNNTIALNQAKAGLSSSQANYDQVVAGSTSQDIQLAQLTVQSDQQSLANAKQNLDTVTKQQAQAVANAFINLMSTGLQAIPSGANTNNGTISITGSYLGTEQGTYTINIYNNGSGQQFVASGLENTTRIITKNIPIALGSKGLYIQFTGNFNNNDSFVVNIPNTAASSYNSNNNAYQNALTGQTSALASAQSQIDSAQNRLAQDQINLEVKQQPPTSQQLESAKASLINAQAQLQNATIAYNNNILKAPFDGQVAQLNSQAGDQATGSTVVAVITNNQSQAVIPLNEVDVASVKLGDKATMTFDAVANLMLTGTVVQIDNIGTVSQGVVNYNVKVAFDVEDPQVKPGMSVNVSIITDTQADTLSVPSIAVKAQGSTNYVLTLDPAQTASTTGVTGLTSNVAPQRVTVQIGTTDGTNTQILNGLKEGDTVVTQTISSSKTTTTATTGTSVLGGLGGGGGAVFRAGGGGGGGRPGG